MCGRGGGGVGVALAPNNSKSNMFRQKYNKFTCFVLYLRSIFMINLVSQKGNLVLKMVRSGQVRSECLTCTFRRSCCSTRLSRTQVPASGTGTKRGRGCKGGGGDRLDWRVQESTRSPTGIGSRPSMT